MSRSAILKQAHKYYVLRKVGYYGLLLVAILLLLAGIYYRWQPELRLSGLFFLPLILALGWLSYMVNQALNVTPEAISRHLNRSRPELEESSQLLLRSTEDLSLLERWQLQRIQPHLNNLDLKKAIPVRYHRAWQLVLLSLFIAAGLVLFPQSKAKTVSGTASTLNAPATKAIQKILPAVKQTSIRVVPPAYTRRESYQVNTPSFKVEAGAKITWEVTTKGEVKNLEFSVGEKKKVAFRPVKGQAGRYHLSYPATQSFIYTLDLNGKKSEYYAVEIIPDQPPTITVKNPPAFTAVAFGAPQIITVQATITDDYGINNARLVATVAKGAGEAVKFKEVPMPLNISLADNKQEYTVRKNLDLKALGLTYGDELYFYLQAHDTYRNYTRTETFLIQLEDTTVTADFDGLAMGINKVPAFFRSQRQLIIDTEKLITEEKVITQAAFRNRSQNLGEEQKILRLRYGKFLGEEYETNTGAHPVAEDEIHTDDDGHDHSGTGSKASDALAPFLHRHDTEEDATFFEPAVKAKLKAALAQMWESELRLRLSQPKNALPFAYKALRLLKEVQQSERVYVRKTGFIPPPFKEAEKRLTGDLTKVESVENQEKQEPKITYPAIRLALTWLTRQAYKPGYAKSDALLLQRASTELAQAALNQPGRYLRALQDLRTLVTEVQTGRKLCIPCQQTVTTAFESLLPPPVKAPSAPNTHRHPLAQKYFQNLK